MGNMARSGNNGGCLGRLLRAVVALAFIGCLYLLTEPNGASITNPASWFGAVSGGLQSVFSGSAISSISGGTSSNASSAASSASASNTRANTDGDAAQPGSLYDNESASNYAYERLDVKSKTMYEALYQGLSANQDSITFTCDDQSAIDGVFKAIMADHPELLYVTSLPYSLVGNQATVAHYSDLSQAEIQSYQQQIDSYVDTCLSGIPADASDYDKSKYVFEYIAQHTVYDLNATRNQDITSVFVGGASVCSGYAKAYQYLMQRLGIPCTLVSGTAQGNAHAWDLVYLDGAYYYVDPTWGDMEIQTRDAGIDVPSSFVDYTYLNATTADIQATHQFNSSFALPACTATADSYFVRENHLVETDDPDLVGALMAQDRANGKACTQFRAANDDVYNSLVSQLFDNQQIAYYITGGSVLYMQDPAERVVTVFL